jgi:hypothetical protein
MSEVVCWGKNNGIYWFLRLDNYSVSNEIGGNFLTRCTVIWAVNFRVYKQAVL